jgi:phage terminase large subunit-like protein
MSLPFTAASLKDMPKDEVKAALNTLSIAQLEELRYDWKFWARDKQIPPETGWYIWYLSAGRSFGKTRCGAEYIRDQVKRGVKDIAIIGRTSAETRDVCLYGKSGLLNVCWEGDKTYRGKHLGFPKYYKNDKKLVWANGAVAKLFSAEEPEAPRGSQFEVCWLDELASWAYQQEMWDQIQFCMRIGRPRIVITTTPRSTPLIRSLVDRGLKGKDVLLTTGSSYENTAMPKQFFDELRDKYEGTRLGQQEIHAAILPDNEGALWTASMIDDCQIDRKDLPELQRIVVAVDPAVTNNVESDMTGIVVAGIDINGKGYVLGDYSVKTSPEAWANKAIELYHKFGASRIVYESNQGKDLIPTLFRTIDENIPLKGVHASQGKIARAEPVSALYEQGKVKHVRNPEDFDANLMELEKQLTSFEPLGRYKSPDRYDALVWGLTELMLKGVSRPKLTLAYSSSSSLR